MKLPRVLILYTGGTFGMSAGLRGSRELALPRLSPLLLRKRLEERVPELRELARCDVDIVLNLDSAHIGPAEWLLIADRVRKQWKNYDGVVVLHGTDTLAYTASALSFLLRPCLKPVVLTGAQRPLAALRTDARRNLISAVEIAARGPREVVRQVTVFFDDRLLQGNRARKRSASEFAAFESPQAGALALVGTRIRYLEGPRGAGGKGPKLASRFSPNVAMLHVTPGFPARAVTDGLLPRVEALVLIIFPSATAPTHSPDFLELLREARRRRVPVVVATEGFSHTPGPRHAGGAPHPDNYEAGRGLLEEGCHWAGEMTPECAYVKTSLLLAQPDGRARFAAFWKRQYADEG